MPNPSLPVNHPGSNGGRYFTIQRANGNSANGKNDGLSGSHQHTLEESHRVKKSNQVSDNPRQAFQMMDAKNKKKNAKKKKHTKVRIRWWSPIRPVPGQIST